MKKRRVYIIMNMKFYKNRLNEMLADLKTLTGLSYAIYSLSDEIANSSETLTAYCQKIGEDKERKKKCNVTKYNAARAAIESGKSVTYRCHGGLCETIVPMYMGISPIGYFVIGQYVDAENKIATRKALKSCCESYKLSYEEMAYLRGKLAVRDKIYIEACLKFTDIIIEYITAHKLITPIKNDAEAALLNYAESHIKDDLSVDALCKILYVSRSQLYKFFKDMGTSPHKYINDLRMEKAKKLLVTTDKKISSVSVEAGFSDFNYFARSFKRKFGKSPKKFRAEADAFTK